MPRPPGAKPTRTRVLRVQLGGGGQVDSLQFFKGLALEFAAVHVVAVETAFLGGDEDDTGAAVAFDEEF